MGRGKDKIILNFQQKQYQQDISCYNQLCSNNPTGQLLKDVLIEKKEVPLL